MHCRKEMVGTLMKIFICLCSFSSSYYWCCSVQRGYIINITTILHRTWGEKSQSFLRSNSKRTIEKGILKLQ